MINIVIDINLINKKQTVYSFYYLLERYDEEISFSYLEKENCINICYGVVPKGAGNIYIPFDDYKNDKLNYYSYNGITYVSFKDNISEPFQFKNENIYFNFDIIFTSFYMLTCMEEYEIEKKDSIERFLADYSLRKEKINIPFFDANSNILIQAIKYFHNNVNLKRSRFQILLTHDVDNVNSRNKYVFIHNMAELLLNRGYRSIEFKLKNLILDLIKNRHDQIENIINIEKNYNAKSEFYFLQGYEHRLGKRYNMQDVSDAVNFIKNNSECVIGLHTNYFSYDNFHQIKEEKETIEKFTLTKVNSGRNHYLRFKVPDTWINLENAGILCDSTLGYSDINGFRAGIARNFIPYDIRNNKLINIAEVPLIIMDGIIMEKDMSFDTKWSNIKYLIDQVIMQSGTASILFHERLICYYDYRKMYEKILDYVVKMSGEFITSKEVIDKSSIQRNELENLFSQI